MKTGATLAALLLVTVVSASVRAQAEAEAVLDRQGLDLGLRFGYALPFGDFAQNSSLDTLVNGVIPIEVEAGFRANRIATLGILFQYGIVRVKENVTTGCGGASSCSGSAVRLGLEGIFRAPTSGSFVPWGGLVVGYEWLNFNQTVNGSDTSVQLKGFEFVGFQAGGDVQVGPQFALGPFVSFSVARYESASATMGGVTMSGDIARTAIHEWLQFGVRGTFSL
jgi:hypothetical protein